MWFAAAQTSTRGLHWPLGDPLCSAGSDPSLRCTSPTHSRCALFCFASGDYQQCHCTRCALQRKQVMTTFLPGEMTGSHSRFPLQDEWVGRGFLHHHPNNEGLLFMHRTSLNKYDPTQNTLHPVSHLLVQPSCDWSIRYWCVSCFEHTKCLGLNCSRSCWNQTVLRKLLQVPGRHPAI